MDKPTVNLLNGIPNYGHGIEGHPEWGGDMVEQSVAIDVEAGMDMATVQQEVSSVETQVEITNQYINP